MQQVEKAEFYAYLDQRGLREKGIAATICEPPVTTWKENGVIVARAKWYDGSEYHGGKQPEFYLAKP
jgi:hypothetical protein